MEKLSISIVGYMDYDELSMAVTRIEQFTPDTLEKKIYVVDNGACMDPEIKEDRKGYYYTGKAVRRAVPESHDELLSLEECYDDVSCVMNEENSGFGSGHNLAVDRADSEYHAIVNPDILIDSDVFSPMIKYMDEHPEVVLLTPRLVGTDGELLHVYRRDPTVLDCFVRRFIPWGFKKRGDYHTMQDMDYDKSFEPEFAQGSFMLVRTAALKNCGGFDERYFMYMEDADICRQLRGMGRIVYYPQAVVIHKWERGSRKNLKLFLVHTASMIKYFNKWGWRFK